MPLLSARRLITVCLFNLGVCVSQLQAAPLNPAEIPADTKWLLHFDVEKAREWEAEARQAKKDGERKGQKGMDCSWSGPCEPAVRQILSRKKTVDPMLHQILRKLAKSSESRARLAV